MKLRYTIFAIIILLFLNNKHTYTQTNYCWNTPNTVTTDWRVNGSPNNWNWMLQGKNHPVYLTDDMNNYSFLMELPYFCSQPQGTGGCGNLNTLQYLFESPQNQDLKPEDGWELIVKNFGAPNTNPNAHDGFGVQNPFFVIYNRFTGRMKIYFAIIGNTTANSAYLRVFFEGSGLKRALLSHAVPIANTLRDFNSQLDFKTFNDYAITNSTTSYYWMVSEVQTEYDPCTCSLIGLPNKNSTLIIRPVTVNTSNVSATIEGTVTQQILPSGSVSSSTDSKGSFSGEASSVLLGAGQAAIKGYTQWDGYRGEYDGMVNKWNTEYKNKVVKDWFDEYVKTHPQYQGISGLNAKLQLWDNLGRTDDEFKKSIGINNLDSYEQNSDWYALKSIAGYLPYVGTAIGIIDFFVNGGKQIEPAKPSPPMVFNVSLKLKGTITNEQLRPIAAFINPGSPTLNAQTTVQPYYNNILGVFNILKTPKVNVTEIKRFENFKFYDFDTGNELNNIVGVNFTNFQDVLNQNNNLNRNNRAFFKQYKIGEDVKYIVNPSAKVDVEMIDACIVLEYKNNPNINVDLNSADLYNQQSYPYYNGLFNNTLILSDRINALGNENMELEYLSNDNTTLRIRTKYVPLSCLKNQSFTLFNSFNPPKVYIKLIVKLKRNDIANSESMTEIVSYDISNNFINAENDVTSNNSACLANCKLSQFLRIVQPTFPNPTATHINFKLEFLNFSCRPYYQAVNEDIDYVTNMSSTDNYGIYGTITIPSNTTISNNTFLKAKSIIVGNDVMFGNNVELVSSNPIEINATTMISPTSTLRIAEMNNLAIWKCPNVSIATLKATDAEILAVCNDNTYKISVNTLNKTEQNITSISNQNKKPELNMNLKPNPTMYNTILSFNSDENRKYYISVTDIMGKEYWDGIEYSSELSGEQNININTSELLDGIYFIKLSTLNGYSETKKLVVIK